ncbi:MAG: NADH-ubiquinone oxidoreductase-F iron-sulfur binding region domain-containing protein [Thermodesulfobacteriota bacterium]|nr:NADH-ubiquinone oxidoreductase-F iron-sulfur binding region domain-containing protein [Thermodesulfobacteriota bacterium]
MSRLNSHRELDHLREHLRKQRESITTTIMICGGTGCQASRAQDVIDALRQELSRQGLDDSVRLCVTGCHGFCEQGPVMVIEPGNVFYCHISPEDAFEIVHLTIMKGEVIERLLYTDTVTGQTVKTEAEIPFYRSQDRQILSQNRGVDPCSIEDYIAAGGYSALVRVINGVSPEDIIAEIQASGLRGRGGGGFPTGRKWNECKEAFGDEKYVICNADEGDPGAYMDRCVLEGNPHLVLEGMMIGARAIGAQKGCVYVRNEYPLAVKHSRIAVDQARELGLLGNNILGSSFSFDVKIARGGGAFVCGESTALMASIEGKVGEPRPKDVHTVVDGLCHKPTVLNNVETWANVPAIILKRSSWFASKGAENSKGTKILALTGRIKNTGLVEVAMGTSLREVVFDIGGGGVNGNPIKAVQTGGPSGGCLPVDKFDLPIDFDVLYEAGSMIGSGGMVVMDESSCMVDVAKYFLTFLQDESCGKCLPCRVGIDRMLEIVTDITDGRGTPGHLDLLEELGETISETALCGLGKTAPNPVLSTLRYFRSEYEAHINEKKCPAGVCKALITYSIDPDKCTGCGICLKGCVHNAITGKKKKPHFINVQLCQKCGICRSECKFDAIQVN